MQIKRVRQLLKSTILPQFVVWFLLLSQVFQFSASASSLNEAAINSNASYFLPTTYRSFMLTKSPNAGFLTPLLNWAQTGHLDNLSLTSSQFDLAGPLSGGVSFSSLTGTFYTAHYLFSVRERFAFNALGEYGHGQTRLSATLGFGLSPLAQMKFTVERLSQSLAFSFDSGDIESRIYQNAFGVRFQQQFAQPFLQNVNWGGYYARAQNKNLAPVVFTSNGANCGGYGEGITCINYRRIAGALSSGFDLGAEFLLTPSTLLGSNLYYDQVKYDTRLTTDTTHNEEGFGGGLKLNQLLSKRLKFSGEASTRKIYDNFQGSVSWVPPFSTLGLELSVRGEHVISRNATANNDSISVQARWLPEGSQDYQTRFLWKKKQEFAALTEWVKTPAVYMKQVLAIAEQITHLVAPGIVEILPSKGPLVGGNVVTITGSNFINGLAVFFGGQLASSISVLSPNTLTAMVPTAVGVATNPVDVLIQNPDGQQALLANAYTYYSPTDNEGLNLFATRPADALHDEGQQATFTSEAREGVEPYSYQWQLSTDHGYQFVNIPQATDSSYTTPELLKEYNGYQYRMAFLDSNDNGVVSQPAFLTVAHALEIKGPWNMQDLVGRTVRFDAHPEFGIAPYQYQWQVSQSEGLGLQGISGEFQNIEGATESYYVTPRIKPEDHLARYQVIVTDAVQGRAVSEIATLRVGDPLDLKDIEDVAQKEELSQVSRNEGQSVILRSEASGGVSPYSYQWQVRQGNEKRMTHGAQAAQDEEGFANVAEGEGGQTNEYTTPILRKEDNGKQYRLVVRDAMGNILPGDSVTLTVNHSLAISQQPVNVLTELSARASFMVTAKEGTQPYHYQWQWSVNDETFVDIMNSDTQKYETQPVTLEDIKKRHRVVVTDATGQQVFSKLAEIKLAGDLLVEPPEDVTHNVDQQAQFITQVRGGISPYRYQWQVKRANQTNFVDAIEGEGGNTEKYTTKVLNLSNHGDQYKVVVTDAVNGREESLTARLAVNPQLVAQRPEDVVENVGREASFVSVINGGTAPFTYQWQFQADPLGDYINVKNDRAQSLSYKLPEVVAADSGNRYRIEVHDKTGALAQSEGSFLTVNPKLNASELENTQRTVDQVANFKVEVSGGTKDYHYQWQLKRAKETDFNNVTEGAGDKTDSYTTALLKAEDDGNEYQVEIIDKVGEKLTRKALLTVNAPFKMIQAPSSTTKNVNQMAVFSVDTEGGTKPLQYQWQMAEEGGDFQVITQAKNWIYFTPPLSLNDNGKRFRALAIDATGLVVKNDQEAVLKVNPALEAKPPTNAEQSVGSPVQFSTAVQGGTGSYFYQWQVRREKEANFRNVYDGEGSQTANYSPPSLELEDDQNQYRVVVQDQAADKIIAGPAMLRIAGDQLAIEQLASLDKSEGREAIFRAEVLGGKKPYTYQWHVKQGEKWVNISGDEGKKNPYIINAVTMADKGNEYRVVVTDSLQAQKTSDPATLNVHSALGAKMPRDITQAVGQQAVFDTKALEGVPPYRYQWQVRSIHEANFKNVSRGEGGQTDRYTTAPLEIEDNSNQYRVLITDGSDEQIIRGPALLTVIEALYIDAQPIDSTRSPGNQAIFKIYTLGGLEPYEYQWQVQRPDEADFINVTTGEGDKDYLYQTANVTVRDSGSLYRVRVWDALGMQLTSQAVRLVVSRDFSVATLPNPTVVEGTIISFEALVNGGRAFYRYRWQKKLPGEALFQWVSAESASKTYKTPAITKTDDQAQYRVVVKDSDQLQVTSDIAVVTVNKPLQISKLEDIVRDEGQIAKFTIEAKGGVPRYYYQWQVSKDNSLFENIPDENSPSYHFNARKGLNNGNYYRVVVEDAVGTRLQSAPALRLVVNNELITSKPDDKDALVGNEITLKTIPQFGSEPYEFQWQRKGENEPAFQDLEGETRAELIRIPMLSDNNSQYQVLVTDKGLGRVVSLAALVTVTEPVTTSPLENQSLNVGQVAFFTTTPEKGAGDYSYDWQISTDGGRSFASVAKGNGLSFYQTDELSLDDHNTLYKVIVKDSLGSQTQTQAKLSVNDKLSVFITPGTAEYDEGQGVLLKAEVQGGTGNFSYQWQKSLDEVNYIDINNRIKEFENESLQKKDAGYYRVVVTDEAHDIKKSASVLLIVHDQLSAKILGADKITTNEGQLVKFSAEVKGGNGLNAYQWQVSANGLNYDNIDSEQGKKQDFFINSPTQNENNCWYRIEVKDTLGGITKSPSVQLIVNNRLELEGPGNVALNEGRAAQFHVEVTGGSKSYAYQWYSKKGDDRFSKIDESSATYKIDALDRERDNASEYQVVVEDTLTREIKTASAQLTVNRKLEISEQPKAQITNQGRQAKFTVQVKEATGTPTYHYQWQVKTNATGVYNNILGAGDASYTTDFVKPENNDSSFQVVVTDEGGGSITSKEALLTVNSKPEVSLMPTSLTCGAERPTEIAAQFKGGVPPYEYQWQISKDGGELFTNVEGGEASGSTAETSTKITVTPFREDEGKTYLYRVIVSDSVGEQGIMNGSATLYVTPPLTAKELASVSKNVGQSARLTVVAKGGTGNGTYHYQWQVSTDNGSTFNNVSAGTGGNTNTYRTTDFTEADTNKRYQYKVIVTDDAAHRIEKMVALSVHKHLQVLIEAENLFRKVGETATFTAKLNEGTGSYHYQWLVKKGNGNWETVGEDALSYTTSPLLAENNGNQYRLLVADEASDIEVSNVLSLKVLSGPVISRVIPSEVPALFSATISFLGANFQDNAEVFWGGSKIASKTISNTQITMQAPNLTAGKVAVYVRNPDGLSSEPQEFFYNPNTLPAAGTDYPGGGKVGCNEGGMMNVIYMNELAPIAWSSKELSTGANDEENSEDNSKKILSTDNASAAGLCFQEDKTWFLPALKPLQCLAANEEKLGLASEAWWSSTESYAGEAMLLSGAAISKKKSESYSIICVRKPTPYFHVSP